MLVTQKYDDHCWSDGSITVSSSLSLLLSSSSSLCIRWDVFASLIITTFEGLKPVTWHAKISLSSLRLVTQCQLIMFKVYETMRFMSDFNWTRVRGATAKTRRVKSYYIIERRSAVVSVDLPTVNNVNIVNTSF